MARRQKDQFVSIEDFSAGMLSAPAGENLPSVASPDPRNLIVSKRGKASVSAGWVPIINTGLTGRILHTGDFHPTPNQRFAPSVLVPDTTGAGLFDLSNRWVDLDVDEITLGNGYKLRVASGSIADSGTEDVIEQSTDGGVTWASSATYTNGTGETQTINGGIIVQLANGRIIYSVNMTGATKNVVASEYSTDNGGSWSAQTHPNTSANAPAEELDCYIYEIKGGASGGTLIFSYITSSAVVVEYSTDDGDNWTTASVSPGGTTQFTQAYECPSGQELSLTFGAITAGTTFLVGASGGTIKKSTDFGDNWATSTDISYPYGAYFAQFDREGEPSGAQVGQFYVVGDGLARSVLFNGHVAAPLGINRPTTAPTTGTTGTGRTGTYDCKYSYVDQDSGQESDLSDLTSQTLSNNNLTITPTASGESQVDRIRFYIKKQGSATTASWSTFYYAGEAADEAVAFTVADTDVQILGRNIVQDQASGGIAVPSLKQITEHQSSAVMSGDVKYTIGSVALVNDSATVTGTGTSWHIGMEAKKFKRIGDTREYTIQAVASTTSLTLSAKYQGDTNTVAGYEIYNDPTEVVFSRTLRPWAIKNASGSRMFLRFGETVTGHASYSNDELIVFTDKNTYMVSGALNNMSSLNKQVLIPGIGCISHNSIVRVKDQLFWISKTGVEAWSAGRGYQAVSEHVSDQFESHRFGQNLSFAVHDSIGDEIMLFITNGTTARAPDTRIRYFYEANDGDGAWMKGDFNGNMTAAANARTTADLPETRLMYWDGSKARPMKVSRTVYAEGVLSGTMSGTVGSATSGDPVTLTIASGTLDTDDDGLDGRYLCVVKASTGAVQEVQIASNTGTVITGVAGGTWDAFTPTAGDIWSVGGIKSQWETPEFVLGTQDGVMVSELLAAMEIL